MNLYNAIIEFSRRYDDLQKTSGYEPLSIMATGGAMSISALGIVPGASARLAGTCHPYSMTELFDFVKPALSAVQAKKGESEWHSVHGESALSYLKALVLRSPSNRFFVASTAALETTRRRRGENVSYVAMQRTAAGPISLWKIVFTKWEEYLQKTKYPKMTLPEVWDKTYKKEDGSINLEALWDTRSIEDEKMTRAILALILDDPKFAHLDAGDKIIRLSFPVIREEMVWAGK